LAARLHGHGSVILRGQEWFMLAYKHCWHWRRYYCIAILFFFGLGSIGGGHNNGRFAGMTDDQEVYIQRTKKLGGEIVFGGKVRDKVVCVGFVKNDIHDNDIEMLHHLPDLTNVTIWSSKLTAESIKHLNSIKTMTSLSVRCPSITDEWIRNLDNKNIVMLEISSNAITSKTCATLADFNDLLILTLISKGIKDDGVHNLGRLSKLESLTLENCILTGKSADDIVAFKSLTMLDLIGIKVDNYFMGRLKSATKLRHLTLSDIQLSDDMLREFANYPSLKRLCLHNAGLTDKSIDHLAKLTNVKYLSIKRNALSKEKVAELRQILKETKIIDQD
jgi:hypothetical protein